MFFVWNFHQAKLRHVFFVWGPRRVWTGVMFFCVEAWPLPIGKCCCLTPLAGPGRQEKRRHVFCGETFKAERCHVFFVLLWVAVAWSGTMFCYLEDLTAGSGAWFLFDSEIN